MRYAWWCRHGASMGPRGPRTRRLSTPTLRPAGDVPLILTASEASAAPFRSRRFALRARSLGIASLGPPRAILVPRPRLRPAGARHVRRIPVSGSPISVTHRSLRSSRSEPAAVAAADQRKLGHGCRNEVEFDLRYSTVAGRFDSRNRRYPLCRTALHAAASTLRRSSQLSIPSGRAGD